MVLFSLSHFLSAQGNRDEIGVLGCEWILLINIEKYFKIFYRAYDWY